MNFFVGNLSFGVREAELRQLFEQYGAVTSANIIMDKMTGKSRGFAFIEMPDKEQGEKAIVALNGVSVQDRKITVNEARPRTEGGGGGGGRPRHGGGDRRGGGGGGHRRKDF